jgi:hypothetical protein
MVWGCDMWELSSMVPINGYIISLWDLKIMGNPHGNPGSFFWSVITFHIKSATIWGIPDFWSHFQTCRTGHLVRYRCGPCQCVLLLGDFVICFWRSHFGSFSGIDWTHFLDNSSSWIRIVLLVTEHVLEVEKLKPSDLQRIGSPLHRLLHSLPMV